MIKAPNHHDFMANGYANAWYINKTGTYTVTLEFWLQKLFYIGSNIINRLWGKASNIRELKQFLS